MGGWTELDEAAASENNLIIVNNQAGADVENSHNYAFWSADSFSNDQYSQTMITKIGRMAGRDRSSGWDFDRFYLGVLEGPNEYRIYRRWDGGYYLLTTGTAETWRRRCVSARGDGSANPVTVTLSHNGNAVLVGRAVRRQR